MSFFKPFAAAAVLIAASGAANAQLSSSFATSQEPPTSFTSSSSSFADSSQVSEPGSLPLIALGVAGAVAVGRFLKRRNKNKR